MTTNTHTQPRAGQSLSGTTSRPRATDVLDEISQQLDQLGPASGTPYETAELCKMARQPECAEACIAQLAERLDHGNELAKDFARRLRAARDGRDVKEPGSVRDTPPEPGPTMAKAPGVRAKEHDEQRPVQSTALPLPSGRLELAGASGAADTCTAGKAQVHAPTVNGDGDVQPPSDDGQLDPQREGNDTQLAPVPYADCVPRQLKQKQVVRSEPVTSPDDPRQLRFPFRNGKAPGEDAVDQLVFTPCPGPEESPEPSSKGVEGTFDDDRDIPLGMIGISKWNRSYDLRPDKQYQDQLIESIRQHGLLHRVTVVRDPDDAEHPYKILAGANRVAALFLSRPDDQVLHPDEYMLLDDLTEADPRCLQISLAENQNRRQSSPFERAVYVRRLVKQEGMKKKDVAKAMRTDPSTISRLLDLADKFDNLPGSWQEDLRRVRVLEMNQEPAVKLGHFVKVATKMTGGELRPEVIALMDRAHTEHWSVAQFDRELQALPPEESESSDGDAPTPERSTKSDGRGGSVGGADGTTPPEGGGDTGPKKPKPLRKERGRPTPELAGLQELYACLDQALTLVEAHAPQFAGAIVKLIEEVEEHMGRD